MPFGLFTAATSAPTPGNSSPLIRMRGPVMSVRGPRSQKIKHSLSALHLRLNSEKFKVLGNAQHVGDR